MAQVETEKLTQILWGAALSRAVCTIAELGIADQIEAGSPQSVESLAGATGTHERSLYRILRFLDSHGIFQEKGNRQFDHTPLSHCIRSDAEGSFRPAAQFQRHPILADIGGGNGSLIGPVLPRYPKLKGLLFDLGHVVRRTREGLKAYGVDDRCSVIEGNFFKSVPGGADTYLFRHIIHDWTDEQSVQILNNCRKVIPNNGRLLIIEAVVPPGNEPSLAKDFDMVMLVFPGGIERTEEEYRFLLEQAGFQLSSITPTASVISVVEGKPI